jgi:hypothetical protein
VVRKKREEEKERERERERETSCSSLLINSILKAPLLPGTMVCAYNPSYQDIEPGGSLGPMSWKPAWTAK